ncbi:MAG: FHA domain-containing protein [Bilifractor sp.]|jgi:hypothetical protein
MIDFLLNSDEVFDQTQYLAVNEGKLTHVFPCRKIRYNSSVKIAVFPDGCRPLEAVKQDSSLDEVCEAGKEFLDAIEEATTHKELYPENFVLDLDNIYQNQAKKKVSLIYLPARVPETDKENENEIYTRRVYGVLSELFQGIHGGDTMIRQIEYQQDQKLGDWDQLRHTLDKRVATEDDKITMKAEVNGEELRFDIGHEIFHIGKDPSLSDGVIRDVEGIAPVHAEVGWNDISFYVIDLSSETGTFVNDVRIVPETQVPIGKGTVIRLGSLSFSVE